MFLSTPKPDGVVEAIKACQGAGIPRRHGLRYKAISMRLKILFGSLNVIFSLFLDELV